jgi:hypothetical protein
VRATLRHSMMEPRGQSTSLPPSPGAKLSTTALGCAPRKIPIAVFPPAACTSSGTAFPPIRLEPFNSMNRRATSSTRADATTRPCSSRQARASERTRCARENSTHRCAKWGRRPPANEHKGWAATAKIRTHLVDSVAGDRSVPEHPSSSRHHFVVVCSCLRPRPGIELKADFASVVR